jgi:hypothetical protein
MKRKIKRPVCAVAVRGLTCHLARHGKAHRVHADKVKNLKWITTGDGRVYSMGPVDWNKP